MPKRNIGQTINYECGSDFDECTQHHGLHDQHSVFNQAL